MPPPTPAQTKALLEDGTLDAWLADPNSGFTRDKYERAMEKVRAYERDELGVLSDGRSPASSAQAAPVEGTGSETLDNLKPPPKVTEGAIAQAYVTAPETKRASAYVPGHGDADTVDGSWWDDIKKKIPQELRDATLLPSRGPVWFEPTDEEATAALNADREAQGLRPKNSRQHLERWKDEQWAKAYDGARKRGEAIYRGRDIDEASPDFMRTAKRMAEMTAPLESFARQLDRSALLGAGAHAVDTGDVGGWKQATREQDESFAAKVGMPPPPMGAELDDAEVAENMDRAGRVMEREPVAGMVGGLVGAIAPGGATGRIAKGVEGVVGLSRNAAGKALPGPVGRALTGALPNSSIARGAAEKLATVGLEGRGLVSGATKGMVEAGVSTFGEQMAAGQVDNLTLDAAGQEGIPWSEQAEQAGITALAAAPLGGIFSAPRGVSRGMREAGNADASAHKMLNEAGGGTTNTNIDGLMPPPGHEEFLKDVTHGPEAASRMKAAQAAGSVLDIQASLAKGAGERASNQMAGNLESELFENSVEIGAIAEDLVNRSENVALATEQQTASFVKRFMDRFEAENVSGKARRHAEAQAALDAEGAPAYPDVPGPNMHIDEISAMQKAESELSDGLETDYPSIDVSPLVDKHFDLVHKMSFLDGSGMPSTTVAKFKKSMDSLMIKKTVDAEDAANYEHAAYNMKELDDGRIEVTLPRRVSPRELDDIIQNLDEMGKYPNSPAPEAARYRQLGARAHEMREDAFKILSETKSRHHMELTENEQMLRSLGLSRSLDKMDAGDVDQSVTVMNNIKSMISENEIRTPDGLAIPRKQFEKWLARVDGEDGGLFDDYMALRDLAKQQKRAEDFDITIGNTPAGKASAYKKIEDAITGRTRDYDAVISTWQSLDKRVAAARAEHTRIKDLFTTLGVEKSMAGIGNAERAQMRTKLNQILLNGDHEYDALVNSAKPEQRVALGVARQAALDTDSMFRKLGFGPRHNQPGFTNATREEIVGGLEEIFKNYKKFGESDQFDRTVDELFSMNKPVREALNAMTGERAFMFLSGHLKSNAKAVFGADRVHTYMTSANDFFKNHIDALISRNKKAPGHISDLGPFESPTPYSMALTQEAVPNDENRSESIEGLSATKALRALMRAVDKAGAEKKQ